MIKGIKFELRKSIKSKKNKLLFLGFIIYVVAFIILLGYKEKEYDKNQHTIFEYELQESGQMLSIKTMELNDLEESNKTYNKVKEENNFYQAQYSGSMLTTHFFSDRIKGNEKSEEDKTNFMIAMKTKYSSLKSGFEKGIIDKNYLTDRGLSINLIDREIEYIDYLLETKQDIMVNPYTRNGANFLKNFFAGFNLIVILIFILLFVIDSYALELREDSYKTLYTSPIRRNTILLSKMIASFILVTLAMIMVLVIAFVTVSLIFGYGELLYPLPINEGVTNLNPIVTNMNQGFIELFKLVLINLFIFMVLTIFIIVFSISLSAKTNSEILSFGILITVLMLTYIMHSIDSFMNINRLFNPISFIFNEDLMSSNLKINHTYGILLQVLFSTLIILLTTFKFRNKDLVGIKGE